MIKSMFISRFVPYLLLVIGCCVASSGCGRQQRIKQNLESAKSVFMALEIYNQNDYGGTNQLPPALSDLVSVGILKEIPKCACADGVPRDFTYIPGFSQIMPDYVILASPPEMDPNVMIVYYGGTAKVLPHQQASNEIAKSRSLIKWARESPKVYKN